MIRLRTLGTLQLHDSEGRDTGVLLAQPKRLALLAYLVLARPRGAHRRDSLVALFWPEQDAEHARNALSQSLHLIRRSLGAETIVSSRGDAVSVDMTTVWCDALAFEAALEGQRLADAIDLYRGDLLEGFHVAAAPELERWVEEERSRLRARYLDALEVLAEQCEARGDVHGAVIHWRRRAAQDLYSTRVALRLMHALAAAGDPAGAIHHARLHESILRDELELTPDPELQALVRQLQTPRPPPDVTARSVGDMPFAEDRSSAPEFTSRPPARRRPLAISLGVVALLVTAGVAIALGKSPRIRSLAVLPLVTISGDSLQRTFAAALHDALITELARYRDLTVISRTSVVRYEKSDKRLPEIARELGVDGVVEGTLFWERGRVRMNVQLVHASDRHLWAESFRREPRDVLLLQSELAAAIAREVRVATEPVAPTRSPAIGTADSVPEELFLKELYLRGRHAEISRTLTGLSQAKEAYRLAIERDSGFALAYAGLSGVYRLMVDYAYVPAHPALDSARLLAHRAVARDSTNPEARTALALAFGDAGEFAAAEREYQRAIQLAPGNARAHYWYAILLVSLGRGEEALREINRSAELDPFAPRGVTIMQRYATFLITGQRPHEREPVARRRMPVRRWDPGEPWAVVTDARDLALQGTCGQAYEDMERARRLVPAGNLRMLRFVAEIHDICGDRARARAVVREMTQEPLAHEHGAWIAAEYARRGDLDSAFIWLDRHTWTTATRTDLRCNSAYDDLRADPRYPALMRRLGLP